MQLFNLNPFPDIFYGRDRIPMIFTPFSLCHTSRRRQRQSNDQEEPRISARNSIPGPDKQQARCNPTLMEAWLLRGEDSEADKTFGASSVNGNAVTNVSVQAQKLDKREHVKAVLMRKASGGKWLEREGAQIEEYPIHNVGLSKLRKAVRFRDRKDVFCVSGEREVVAVIDNEGKSKVGQSARRLQQRKKGFVD
ncbi:hypothetical protein BDV95DRAFT_593165 [Massariosphaeria phaeospora]|uniref:Uncharacterized protein n=1 Tax=Massariosphaeria phaeospora TaxID=100035 RepID=A0A7C8I9A7_9PLEO|nr:hypothetical protein BDV95DRAFT_593165 [Massariosphaeria phaeospora]